MPDSEPLFLPARQSFERPCRDDPAPCPPPVRRAADAGAARLAAFRRMDDSFPVNRGLRPIFLVLANAHRDAIDYIEQAPVIVAAATRGTTHVPWSERAFIQEQLARQCERGARLRDVMAVHGLPLPLRKLEAAVMTASRGTVIRRLALMNPSTLAQVIPATRQKQHAWLEALEQWCSGMADRSEGQADRCPLFEWAAVNLVGITFSEARGVRHLVDYVAAHAATFNPRWTLARARREEQAWHEALADDEQPDAAPQGLVDYAPLPKRWEKDGFRFVALQTARALRLEGAAMHHCVASYWHNVAVGRSRIYSVQRDGGRVATLELGISSEDYRWGKGGYQLRQLVGVRNARPVPEVRTAAGAFLKAIEGAASTPAYDPGTRRCAPG